MPVELVTDYSFLVIDQEKKTVRLEPGVSLTSGTYEEANLIFAMDRDPSQYQISVKVKAQIICELSTVGFKTRTMSLTYFIGDLNFYYNLPSVVQKPDCNL